MNHNTDLYSFVLRGDVAQDAVNRLAHRESKDALDLRAKISARLPFDLIEAGLVESAGKMALVYTVIAAFENSARKFLSERLLEDKGAEWWDKCISQDIRTRAEKRKTEEESHRYHGSRGNSMIFYCDMSDLEKIINNNQEAFADYIPSVEWARQIFRAVERSRNVIMHAGELSMNDIERVSMNIRDWIRQVGG